MKKGIRILILKNQPFRKVAKKSFIQAGPVDPKRGEPTDYEFTVWRAVHINFLGSGKGFHSIVKGVQSFSTVREGKCFLRGQETPYRVMKKETQKYWP